MVTVKCKGNLCHSNANVTVLMAYVSYCQMMDFIYVILFYSSKEDVHIMVTLKSFPSNYKYSVTTQWISFIFDIYKT